MNDLVTELISIAIGPFNIKLHKIKDIDVLYEALLAKGEDHEDVKDERIPYWAELWPSSIALSKYLVNEIKDLSNKRVLEIGCGLGLTGITAGIINAKVIMTDYLEEALIIAKQNWSLNLNIEPELRKLDWRYPDLQYQSDLILAADVLYEKRTHPYIADFIQQMLVPGGMVLLADPGRSASKDFFLNYADRLSINSLITFDIANQGIITQVDIYKLELIE
ncbi:MAG TPA: methyltransferase domain-containing protein [Saprospiraceae bacterium]|nr:methyltransferase domain-containing protein [Saprospiraceae bacterium]